MNKVLLLFCCISLTAHAGTGGGISTPPGKSGFAELPGARGSLFRMPGSKPLPLEIVVDAHAPMASFLIPSTSVNVSNDSGDTRSYLVTDGDVMHQFRLKDRRQILRVSIQEQR